MPPVLVSSVPICAPTKPASKVLSPWFSLVLSASGQVLTMTLPKGLKTLAPHPACLAWPTPNRIYSVSWNIQDLLGHANPRQLPRGLPTLLQAQPALVETCSGSDLEVAGSLPEPEGHCWECSHSADTIHTQMASSHGKG